MQKHGLLSSIVLQNWSFMRFLVRILDDCAFFLRLYPRVDFFPKRTIVSAAIGGSLVKSHQGIKNVMPLNSHLSTSTQIILVWRKGSAPTNTFFCFSDRPQPPIFFSKGISYPRVLRKFHYNQIGESKVLCHFVRLPNSVTELGNFICMPVESFKVYSVKRITSWRTWQH